MPRQDVLPVAAAQETDRTITDDAAVKGYVVPDGCHGIFSASYYFTVILQLTVVPSSFTLIVAVPFLRAEITPFLVTDATEELLLE